MSGDQMHQGGEGIEAVEGNHRRDFLKKAGIAGAVAWTAPTLLSSAAHAQGSQNPGIRFVSASSAANGTTVNNVTSLTVPAPTGIQAGDLLLAIVATNPNTNTPLGQTPGGTWTQLNTQNAGDSSVRSFLLSRVASGSETSFTFTRSYSGIVIFPGLFRAAIVAYRNVAAIENHLGVAQTNTNNPKNFPIVTSSGNANGNNSVVVRLGAGGNATAAWPNPAGFTTRSNSGSSNRPVIVFDSVQSTAGNSTAAALTTTGTAIRAAMHTVALQPLPKFI